MDMDAHGNLSTWRVNLVDTNIRRISFEVKTATLFGFMLSMFGVLVPFSRLCLSPKLFHLFQCGR